MSPITKQQQRMFTTEALGIIPAPSPAPLQEKKNRRKGKHKESFLWYLEIVAVLIRLNGI